MSTDQRAQNFFVLVYISGQCTLKLITLTLRRLRRARNILAGRSKDSQRPRKTISLTLCLTVSAWVPLWLSPPKPRAVPQAHKWLGAFFISFATPPPLSHGKALPSYRPARLQFLDPNPHAICVLLVIQVFPVGTLRTVGQHPPSQWWVKNSPPV